MPERESGVVLVRVEDAQTIVEFVSFPDRYRTVEELQAAIDARDRVAAALEGGVS
jgi:hypothetical protein